MMYILIIYALESNIFNIAMLNKGLIFYADVSWFFVHLLNCVVVKKAERYAV